MNSQHSERVQAFIDYIEDVLVRASRLAEGERAGMTQQVLQQGLEAVEQMNALGREQS